MHDTQIVTMAELTQENPFGAYLAGVELVIVAEAERVHVFEGTCPHQGTLLAEGTIENNRIRCRAHGWQFDCATGKRQNGGEHCLHRFSLHRFSAVVEDGKVLVDRTEVAAWAAARGQQTAEQTAQTTLTISELPGPDGLPLLGNMHQIKIEKFHLILEEWRRQYGDLYQFRLGKERTLVVADPEMVQEILRDRPNTFARLGDIRRTIEELGIQGVFSSEGEQWRRHRQIVMRAFDVRHLRGFYPVLRDVTQRLEPCLQALAVQQLPIDIQKVLMRYTVDVTTNLAFGYDMNTLENDDEQLQKHLERIFPMIAFRGFMPVRYWNYIKLPADRALDASLAELRVAVDRFVDHARQQLAADPRLKEHPQNLLQAMLAAQEDETIELSDLEIYGNVFTFLLAGEDTTANTIAWMMYFMAEHPEVQRRMQAEADECLAESAVASSYDKLGELRYIEAVAHETMRFKPVATFLAMQALQDATIGRVQVPEGTPVTVLIRPKALDESEFTAADEFRPERWLDYTAQENPHHRKSYLPFGAGPRLCPGRSLALAEIKMAVGMICRHFNVVHAKPENAVEERFNFTVMPDGLEILLQPRALERISKSQSSDQSRSGAT